MRATERSAFGIIADLAEAGYVIKEKDGRRNHCRTRRYLNFAGREMRHRLDPDPS